MTILGKLKPFSSVSNVRTKESELQLCFVIKPNKTGRTNYQETKMKLKMLSVVVLMLCLSIELARGQTGRVVVIIQALF